MGHNRDILVLLACLSSLAISCQPIVQSSPQVVETKKEKTTPIRAPGAPVLGSSATTTWKPVRYVRVVDDSGRPLKDAHVAVQTPSLTYTYVTGTDGKTLLPEIYLQEPQWIGVYRDGYESLYAIRFPSVWPQTFQLRRSKVPQRTRDLQNLFGEGDTDCQNKSATCSEPEK